MVVTLPWSKIDATPRCEYAPSCEHNLLEMSGLQGVTRVVPEPRNEAFVEDSKSTIRDAGTGARLIGQAPEFVRAIEKLPAIARSGAAVFIFGESGTGKELVARAIHYLSNRAPFPFVAVNCGSFPDSLLEAEFFGHERGAFTDAHARREGLIAQANGGTLFLDEIDHLQPKAQIDLLRVLQEKKYRALGSTSEKESNVRFLAATNSSIGPLLCSRDFRADLFYRLCVFTIHLPPLRHRREDICALAEHFLQKHRPPSVSLPRLTPSALAALTAYEWPGNIRELENAIVRGIHLGQNATITVDDLGLSVEPSRSEAAEAASSFKLAKRKAVEIFEREYLDRLMLEHRGNVTNAARAAGKDRRDLGKLLKKHRLNPRLFYAGRESVSDRWPNENYEAGAK
jgi:DNA-binding NtrC family response regulator